MATAPGRVNIYLVLKRKVGSTSTSNEISIVAASTQKYTTTSAYQRECKNISSTDYRIFMATLSVPENTLKLLAPSEDELIIDLN